MAVAQGERTSSNTGRSVATMTRTVVRITPIFKIAHHRHVSHVMAVVAFEFMRSEPIIHDNRVRDIT